MTTRRILCALLAIKQSLPCFDAEALQWCRDHYLIETVEHKAMPADVLTVTGANLLNMSELYFGQTLKAFHQSGQLRRPDHGTNEEHNDTHEQERRSGKGKARKEKQVKDHGARYGRGKCAF